MWLRAFRPFLIYLAVVSAACVLSVNIEPRMPGAGLAVCAPPDPELSLCWVENGASALPQASGFYFSRYAEDDGVLYHAGSMGSHPVPFCRMEYAGRPVPLKDCVVAVSPRHGTVFASAFDVFPGTGVYVHESGRTSHLNAEDPMQAWLYNTGVVFAEDSQGRECCLYAEYSHARKPTRRVFKATYPYSDPANWRVVLELDADAGHAEHILHCHQITRDPYTSYLYLTTGDEPEESRIYCSRDLGENWELVAEKMSRGMLRSVNILALEDAFYWASDDCHHHSLMTAERRADGVMDAATIRELTPLPENQATNSLAYDAASSMLFFYDRAYPHYMGAWRERMYRFCGPHLQAYTYSLQAGKIEHLRRLAFNRRFLPLPSDEWFSWGNRGRCFIHYPQNGVLAVGFCEHYIPCLIGAEQTCGQPEPPVRQSWLWLPAEGVGSLSPVGGSAGLGSLIYRLHGAGMPASKAQN